MKIGVLIILTAFLSQLFSIEKEFVLITSLYDEQNAVRKAEYMECLLKNLENKRIKQIHIFYETSDRENEMLNFLNSFPVKVECGMGRPTFAMAFNLVNSLYLGENIIIANADIYFDESLGRLDEIDFDGKFIALSRWDILPGGGLDSAPHRPMYSHDAWIFNTPITQFDNGGIKLGTLHCDGYIAYKAFTAGYKVFNPCYSIQCAHLQLSGVRSYTYFKPVNRCLTVHPCRLEKIRYSNKSDIR